MGVGEGGSRRLELLEEPAGHRHVEAAQVRGERLGVDPRSAAQRRLRVRVGTRRFIRMNSTRREGIQAGHMGDSAVRGGLRPHRKVERGCDGRGAQRRHHIPMRRGLVRPERGRDRLRVPLRQMEEPRQDVAPVLGRQDLRELDYAREAETAVTQRLDDLRESLDEPRGGLPVESGALREAQLPVQEIKERGVPELDPQPLRVEVREGDEELGERGALALEELGEAGGEIACGGHEASIDRDFGASPDARIRVRERECQRGLENSLARLRRTRGESCRTRSGIPARSLTAEIIWR